MDVRVIVPVMTDGEGQQVWYWAAMGVKLAEMKGYYAVAPRAVRMKDGGAVSPPGAGDAAQPDEAARAAEALAAERDLQELDYQEHTWVIPVYVFREVILGREPPTREEYRAICDQGKTAEGIEKLLVQQFGP